MKFGPLLVLSLSAFFCATHGRIVMEESARAAKGGGGKGLVLQLCKDDTALEYNVIVCLFCRGFSRLCFTIPTTSSFGNNFSTSTRASSSAGTSTNTTPTANTSEAGGEESGKSL